MMGIHQSQSELFSYKVNLDKRVRADHPLRRVAAEIDFTFIRAEVAECYGHNGHVSIDPAILLKMMFLLFFDDIASAVPPEIPVVLERSFNLNQSWNPLQTIPANTPAEYVDPLFGPDNTVNQFFRTRPAN